MQENEPAGVQTFDSKHAYLHGKPVAYASPSSSLMKGYEADTEDDDSQRRSNQESRLRSERNTWEPAVPKSTSSWQRQKPQCLKNVQCREDSVFAVSSTAGRTTSGLTKRLVDWDLKPLDENEESCSDLETNSRNSKTLPELEVEQDNHSFPRDPSTASSEGLRAGRVKRYPQISPRKFRTALEEGLLGRISMEERIEKWIGSVYQQKG